MSHRLAAALLALCCAPLAAPHALAAKPAPSGAAAPPPPLAAPSAPSAACQSGILSWPEVIFAYIIPPDDRYYLLLKPEDCPTCGPGGRAYTLAHIRVSFPAEQGPCSIPVRVSITPAEDPDGDGCFTPAPFAAPLCPETRYVIDDRGAFDTCLDYALPIASGCCVSGPVFLTVAFDQGTCPYPVPRICGPRDCVLCRQFNWYPGIGPPGDDLCAAVGPYGYGGLDMWADSECCSPTPNTSRSWGRLKTLYR